MRFEKKILIALVLLSALLMAGCNLSLAGDVTPPPNYVAPTLMPTNPAGGDVPSGGTGSNQPAAASTVFPLVPPDPAQGAAIYAEKCEPCHGQTGMGDGPQGAQLPNPPAAIGSPDLARQKRPSDWFSLITNGNMQKFMPPFAQALSDRQRWDVLAYVYSLSATKDNVAQGKTVYEQNCAECHGSSGGGDGPKAASLSSKPVAWAKDESRLARLSADDMVKIIENGQGEMPAYKDKLNQSQSYQLADYIRSLSFSSGAPLEAAAAGTPAAGTPAAGSTPEAGTPVSGTPAGTAAAGTPAAVSTASITGQVTNGTPGGSVPKGLKVTLQGYNGMTPAFNQSVDAADDGSYTFKDVQVDANFVYFVQVDANGVTYNSDILHGTDIKGPTASLPVKIFEPSTDASGLTVDRLHVFFDFSKPGIVQVVNLYIVSNPSDKVIVSPAKGKPIISFELPAGATNLQFQDGALGDRYVQTDKGFGDTMGVAPGMGQHQVLFAYDMPYTNGLNLALTPPLPVDAAIVMVPPGVNIKSGQLTDAGQQDVQGTSIHMYQANNSLKAGQTLSMSLSGNPGQPSAATGQNSMNTLLIGLGAFGLVLVGVGVWLYMRARRSRLEPAYAGADAADESADASAAVDDESSESLLDAIVALDDLHASGDLPEAAYQERRADLKARLGDALAREKGK